MPVAPSDRSKGPLVGPPSTGGVSPSGPVSSSRRSALAMLCVIHCVIHCVTHCVIHCVIHCVTHAGLMLGASRENLLDALLRFAARQEHAAAAALTLEADVCAKTHDAPVCAAAGVRLAQPHAVVQAEIGILHWVPPRRHLWPMAALRHARYRPRWSIYSLTVSGTR